MRINHNTKNEENLNLNEKRQLTDTNTKMTQMLKLSDNGASLVAQWLRICLPMQGTQVRALVWEDPTCRGATKPVSHNC